MSLDAVSWKNLAFELDDLVLSLEIFVASVVALTSEDAVVDVAAAIEVVVAAVDAIVAFVFVAFEGLVAVDVLVFVDDHLLFVHNYEPELEQVPVEPAVEAVFVEISDFGDEEEAKIYSVQAAAAATAETIFED